MSKKIDLITKKFYLKMGNELSRHIEQAKKTGVLQLRDFKLTKVPPELFQIAKSIRNLDLSHNRLTIITSNLFTNMENLKTLNISNNKIESISGEIGRCVKLESLDMSHNLLKDIPNSVNQLKNLKKISINNNQLTRIPKELSQLTQLDFVDLSSNKIKEIEDYVENFYCIELNLNENKIKSISEKISACPRLKVIRLEKNCLQVSSLPVSILKDSQVSLINFDGNHFSKKDFENLDGYEKYMERYTATRRKFD
ncbi:leucine-rich repeat-containing 57 isoform X2 [Brachionus plicatilis]|uniref:Leucine-rich repeat-containing 57 isoform X2 n=1 Tax=Brachionus plicatilis TaxID=10195 RepID=A0A3M7SIB3_BRAPC|nr:leucine-rich repeat-containing 57 isoform X2 [Brachionus plicatilis]